MSDTTSKMFQLQQLALSLGLIETQGGDAEDWHWEADDLLTQALSLLASDTEYEAVVQALLTEYERIPKWYA